MFVFPQIFHNLFVLVCLLLSALARSKEMDTQQNHPQTSAERKAVIPLHDFWKLHSGQKLVIFPYLTNGSFKFTFMLLDQLSSFLLLLAATVLFSKL